MNIRSCILCAVCFPIAVCLADSLTNSPDFKMLFHANGQVTLGVHLWGHPRFGDLGPGYRSDLAINTEWISYKNLIFDFLTAASTSIARLPESPVRLDKIRYTLMPDLRYPFRKTILTAALYHECIHTLSRAEDTSGSTWWNAAQVGFGTKGAYPYYFIQKYNNRDFSLRNSFDANIALGYYLRGRAPLIGHNQNYNIDVSGLLRYHFGIFRNQTIFIDLLHHVWYTRDYKISAKVSGEINYVILAFDNIATLYFNQSIIDQNPYDNEYSLGAIGIKILF